MLRDTPDCVLDSFIIFFKKTPRTPESTILEGPIYRCKYKNNRKNKKQGSVEEEEEERETKPCQNAN
jgi:hypothetical protein